MVVTFLLLFLHVHPIITLPKNDDGRLYTVEPPVIVVVVVAKAEDFSLRVIQAARFFYPVPPPLLLPRSILMYNTSL